jgi:Right handed beta helix region
MAFNTTSTIAEDWNGGYKLELSLGNDQSADNWTLNFNLPYKVSAAYGVDLIQNTDGSYSMSGQNGWANLAPGQTINPILIVEDQGQYAQVPQFFEQQINPINTIDSPNQIDPANPSDLPSGAYAIDVDRDFGGDLASAIAAANPGDVVQLGGHSYYTSGITIDKDITLDGQEGSVIDGNGTLNSIITISSGASGATIQDLEITNGNNGIYGHAASNLTIQNLVVHNIGKNELTADGNQTGIAFDYATGLQLSNTTIYDVDRKGISVGDTNGAQITNVNVSSVNLAAHHSQSHDAAGIKFYNTNNVVLKDSYFEKINAFHIWSDTTNATVMENNTVMNVGSDFLAPSFNSNVEIAGIYNEKSSNSIVRHNEGTTIGDFTAYKATEFSTQTMTMEDNNFSKIELGTTDYWVNQAAEMAIATTEDPAAADFNLISQEYYAQAVF